MGYDEAFDEVGPHLFTFLFLFAFLPDEMMTATNVWMITTTGYSMCICVRSIQSRCRMSRSIGFASGCLQSPK